ncbi:MAG TPA: MFS transporter [Gemmatimonadaceae bacterium]|nr:MFS transporter [Gemmatimonadaceae bacterium]
MPDSHPQRWRTLLLLSAAELLGMSLWFAASAVSAQLGERWSLNPSQTGWLTTIVQLGFVAGTAVSAMLNLADVIPSRRLFATSALIGAAVNGALLIAPSYSVALSLRFLTGFSLAGVYPPAMKMISTWFKEQRGLAIGTIVGALTVGKATPYLVHAIPNIGIDAVILTASVGAIFAGLLVAMAFHEGPYPFAPRPFSWGLVATVVRVKQWRLATGGYLGHMWELYAFWAWIPAYLAASAAISESGREPANIVSLIAFGTIAVGGLGCVWGGLYADRHSRERLVTISLIASGTCSLIVGLFFGKSILVLAPVALVWGFFVVADSAQFSALVTESVPGHAVGTALTVQTSIGFLLTMITMQLVPAIAARTGWQWAFALLAVGPLAGIASIRALTRLRASPDTSGAIRSTPSPRG